MSQQDIKDLEDNMKELQKVIDQKHSLDRLLKNRDFKRVIENDYLRDEAVRLVHLRADPNMQDPSRQESINKQIDAIGYFTAFLDMIGQRADGAREAFDECEEVRAELEQESEA